MGAAEKTVDRRSEGDANALAGAVVQLPKTCASKATAVALQMLVPDPETVLVPAIVASSHPFLITLGAPRSASAAGLGIGSADTTSSAAAEQPAYTRAANKTPPAAGPATNSTNRKRSAAAAQSPCSTAAKPTTPAAANSIGSADGKRSAAAAQPPYSTATNPTAPPSANSIGSADGKRSSAAEQLPYSTAAKPPAPAAKLDMGSNGKRIPETENGGKRAKSSAPPKQLSRPAKKSTPSSVGGRASGLAHTDIAASPAVIALASASAAPPAVIASGSASAMLAAVIASGNASAALHPVISGKLLPADPRNAWLAAGIAPRQHVTEHGLPACTMQSIAKKHGVQVNDLRSSFVAAEKFGAEKKHLKPTEKLVPGEIIRLPLAEAARNVLTGTWVSWKVDDELELPARLTHYADGRMQMFVHTDDAVCKFCVIAISHSCLLTLYAHVTLICNA